VRLKERFHDTEIIVVSIGRGESEEQLRKALAMGADRAILIEAPHELDSLGIATELAEIAEELQPDIILMGKQATDDDCNQAAQMLAALLDIPQATFASKVEVNPSTRKVHVTRETDTGEETLEMSFPCLITSDLRLNEPRYIALPGIIKARNKPLEKRSTKIAPQPKTITLSVEAPPTRAPGKIVKSVDELLEILRQKEILQNV
jgi:electron transfer flavoprotein beta subunit